MVILAEVAVSPKYSPEHVAWSKIIDWRGAFGGLAPACLDTFASAILGRVCK